MLWGRRFVGGGLWGSCFVGPPPATRPCQAPCWRLQVPCLCGYVRKGSWREARDSSPFEAHEASMSRVAWQNTVPPFVGCSAAIPDHHCKQTVRSTIIFEELRPAESPRFKHTASPALPDIAFPVFCGESPLQPNKGWNSDAHRCRDSRRSSLTQNLRTN